MCVVIDARWVCLDIGETLVDETRVWTTWAGVLGVTPLVLHAALGVAVAAGRPHGQALDRFDPSWPQHLDRFEAAYGGFVAADLYPDALEGLGACADAGLRVAVIGNQPAARSDQLRALGVTADVVVMSEELGAAKPSAAFFGAALAAMGGPSPAAVTYIGDRIDNDVRPAAAHGMRAVHLRRGPWGILGPQDDGTADAVVDDLEGALAAVLTWT